jgi:hypothetical protein
MRKKKNGQSEYNECRIKVKDRRVIGPVSTLARTNFALNVTVPRIWGSIVTRDSPKPGLRPTTILGQPPIRFMSESASVVSLPLAPMVD